MKPDWKSLPAADRSAHIASVWFSGIRAAQIASMFDGASKNSIIGHYNRYPSVDYPLRRPKPKSTKTRLVASPRKPVQMQFRTPAPSDPGMTGTRLEDLRSRQCKWPLNDGGPFLFCAAPAGVSENYCPYHKEKGIMRK
jgi:GcrA cell cycle regulator